MFTVLDAALKLQSKNGQKACLIHALIPEFLGFNAASQYKGFGYSHNRNIFSNNYFRILLSKSWKTLFLAHLATILA